MHRKFFWLGCSLLLFCRIHAQNVNGIVRSQTGKEPLMGVIVYVKNELASTETDSMGRFQIEVSTWPATLYFETDGFYKDSLKV
ncbi:MAG TPA: carboxypeptidase-like regulatory domain-containing protein, partial [Cytophagales bacterium]|nr:carboxypeptidase-like regulatory domain-containing protein [Cytophagales bacterium]